ncbi:hypothetical protein [Cytobacillus horneckiae]|nr:hypothetical protein [Cytobacillus horneckiae]MCM3178375.1 hypothetical protein [Cytobacillus horneckiae]NRG45459.1 hypothetical protein [Bacillus sp. CRN 9]
MGKRKSSPRLATTSSNRCCYNHYFHKKLGYTSHFAKKLSRVIGVDDAYK